MEEPTLNDRHASDAPGAPEVSEISDRSESPGEVSPPPYEMAAPVIEVRRVSKRIRGALALRNVTLTVRQGQVYGLLGAAGSGKSTLAKLLLGFLHPDSGGLRVLGSTGSSAVHIRAGYLPQKARYHGNISGRRYLRFHAGLSGLSGRDAGQAAEAAIDLTGIGPVAARRIGSYSKENLRRLGLAVALVSGGAEPPELLILDEPTAGLGEVLGETMRDVLTLCRESGSTILICSQELTPVERLCTHVGILRAGRLIAQSPVDATPMSNIVGVAREGALEMTSALVEYLQNLALGVSVEGGMSDDQPLIVSLPVGPEVPRAAALKAAAMRAMLDARWEIVSVYTESRDLDSLYLQAVPASRETGEKTVAEGKEKETVVPEEAARVPATAPLQSASPGTSPLASLYGMGEPAQDTGPDLSSGVMQGPSTRPLAALDSDLLRFDDAGEPGMELRAAQLTPPQIEARKLRDRSNGSQPGDPDEASEETDNVTLAGTPDSAALVSDGR